MPQIEGLIIMCMYSEIGVRGSIAQPHIESKLSSSAFHSPCGYFDHSNRTLLGSIISSEFSFSKMKTGTEKQSRFFTGHYTKAEFNSICKSGMGSTRVTENEQTSRKKSLSQHMENLSLLETVRQ